MLGWAIAFLTIALIAGILGFGGIADGAAGVAKIIFVVFLIAFVLALIFGEPEPLRATTATAPDPWASIGQYGVVREITTPSGIRCVVATGAYHNPAISCDWTKP